MADERESEEGRARHVRRLRSIKGPVILFVVSLLLIIALLVLWNFVLAYDYQRIKELTARDEEFWGAFHWTFIAIGSCLFVASLVLLTVLAAQLFTQIRFSQRLSASIAAFTHELNSPLASIKMFAQTLGREGLGAEERRRFSNLVLVDVERLAQQISNVLHGAQLESIFGFPVSPVAFDLREYLEDYVEQKRVHLERLETPCRLDLTAAREVVPVRLDRYAFRAVLDNLVDNAIKYAKPEGARVGVVLLPAERSDRAVVEVRDEGRGIPRDDLARVFDRFGRVVHPTDADPGRKQPGTGLGLWIVQALVEAHHGRVSAHSPGIGRGTTIRLELPRLRALESSPDPEAAGAGPDPGAAEPASNAGSDPS